jgi:hypothetical protein
LNPCDYQYFLWRFLTESVYRNNPHTAEEVKGEITAPVENIIEETLASHVKFQLRSTMTWMHGDHILNMLLLK